MCQTPLQTQFPKMGTLSVDITQLVPKHPAAKEALDLALASLPASIFYHSIRVYLYAQSLLNGSISQEGFSITTEPVSMEPHVLFVASMLHDFGTISKYDNNPIRFELLGADQAVQLLRSHGEGEASIREAWLAMSLHTSPGIPEQLGGAVQAFRLAILAEFGAYDMHNVKLPVDQQKIINNDLPRLDIEQDLGDAVVRQALIARSKAPAASWPGVLLRAKEDNPGWEGVNKGFSRS